MSFVIYSLCLCIIICVIAIWYITTFNKYQSLIIRINEAEADIDSVLRKRFDLLNKAIGIIKNIVKSEEISLEKLSDLKSKKLSNFELDRKLYESINEFYLIKETYPTLLESDNFVKIDLNINESEIEISALRRYYNDIITDYNHLVKAFPSNIVAKITKYKVKTYFDGKNMFDEKINDFKL